MEENTEKTIQLITFFFLIRVIYDIYYFQGEWFYPLIHTIIDYLLIYLLIVPIANKLEKTNKKLKKISK